MPSQKKPMNQAGGETSPRICTMRLEAQLNVKEELAEA